MVDVIDTDGIKSILPKGALGYDDYTAGGDAGRLYIGTGITNKAIATLLEVNEKQDILVSGTNIKTINNVPVLGSGDIIINSGSSTNHEFNLSTGVY